MPRLAFRLRICCRNSFANVWTGSSEKEERAVYLFRADRRIISRAIFCLKKSGTRVRVNNGFQRLTFAVLNGGILFHRSFFVSGMTGEIISRKKIGGMRENKGHSPRFFFSGEQWHIEIVCQGMKTWRRWQTLVPSSTEWSISDSLKT